MSTQKSIKIQKNKILTYAIEKEGFKNVYNSVMINDDKIININLKNLNYETPQYQLGDRLFGISTFVDYFIPFNELDVDVLKYITASQTTGNSLSNISVVKDIWLQQVEQTLSIETSKGSSNTFIFTFDGTNWQLTGAVTVADISVSDIYNVYGIDYTGTAVSGDVITVVETQYNRFAVFVLDRTYRSKSWWYRQSSPWGYGTKNTNYPITYTGSDITTKDAALLAPSATCINEYAFVNNSVSDMQYLIFKKCLDIGKFILPNGIILNPLIPNYSELQLMYSVHNNLDQYDPTVTEPNQEGSFSVWGWGDRYLANNIFTCLELYSSDSYSICIRIDNTGNYKHQNKYYSTTSGQTENGGGFYPIFEVPVM